MIDAFIALFRYAFWFWFTDPEIGEEYTHADKLNDPWNTWKLTVINKQGNWYRLRCGSMEQSNHKADLIAFYRKTADTPSYNDDEPPF